MGKTESKHIDIENNSENKYTGKTIQTSIIYIWCFNDLKEEDDKINRTIDLLSIPNDLTRKYSNTTEVEIFLCELELGKKVILILSGSIAFEIKDTIKLNDLILSVFIYCNNIDNHKEWIKDFSKIKMLTNKYQNIENEVINLNNLNQIIPLKNEDNILWRTSDMLKDVKGGYYFDSHSSCIDYIYLETIYYLMGSKLDYQQSVDDFLKFCMSFIKEDNQNDKNILEKIKIEIKEKTFENNIINWYTKETFFYKMLNITFRKDNIIDLFDLRYPIYHLNEKLNELNQITNPRFLYRGTKFSKNEMNVINLQIGKSFLLRGFNSTSDLIDIPKKYFSKKNKTDSNLLNVLIIIKLKESDLKIVKSIKHLSALPHENEWLLNNLSFIKINTILPSKHINSFDIDMECELTDFTVNKTNFNPDTLKYKDTLQKEITRKSYNLDKLYLVEILNKTRKDEEAFKLLKIIESNYPDNHTVYNELGGVYLNKGEYNNAIEYFNKCLTIQLNSFGEKNPDVATSFNNLGKAYLNKGEYDQAIEYYIKCLNIDLNLFREKHPCVATSYNNLGTVYKNKGEYDEAIEYYNKSLKIRLNTLGEQHPDVASSFNNLGTVYKNKGDYEKSIEYYIKSLKIRINSLGEQHPDVASSYNNLGNIHKNKQDYDKAIEFYNKSLNIRLISLGEHHPDVSTSYNNLGVIHLNRKEFDKAIEYFNKSVSIQSKSLGENHPSLATSFYNLGLVYDYSGDYFMAFEYYNKSLTIRLNSLGEKHISTIQTRKNLENLIKKFE